MAVTAAAMITTKAGSRIDDGMSVRNAETSNAEITITAQVAPARPTPATTEVDTASSGHKPSNCTNAGFSLTKPRRKSVACDTVSDA